MNKSNEPRDVLWVLYDFRHHHVIPSRQEIDAILSNPQRVFVRIALEAHMPRWRAEWEASELHARHAQVVASSRKLEAL